MYKPQWVGRKRNRQSTKVPAYSISRVFLMELPYHNTLDTCSNMSKNATNDKIQSPVDSQTCFQLCLRTARHLTVVIVISFILSCYFRLFVIELCLSAAKVRIKSRITKKNSDYLRNHL